MSLCFFACGYFAARVGDVGYGASHIDGGACTYDNTGNHCEGEAADGVTAQDEDAEEHEEGRER